MDIIDNYLKKFKTKTTSIYKFQFIFTISLVTIVFIIKNGKKFVKHAIFIYVICLFV